MMALAGAAVATLALVAALAFVVECWTAPTLDERGYLIADPYGRLGPAFKEGEPVPPEHEGRRYC